MNKYCRDIINFNGFISTLIKRDPVCKTLTSSSVSPLASTVDALLLI